MSSTKHLCQLLALVSLFALSLLLLLVFASSGLNEKVEALRLFISELSKVIGHLHEILVANGSIDLGEDLFIVSGLGAPGQLREVVVDGVSDVLTDTLLHEVLAVASLAEHLTDLGAVVLLDLREPVEGSFSRLSVHVVEALTIAGMHVGNEVVNICLGLEEDLA